MKHNFIKNIEKMINPIEVGTIHFMQSFINSIPPTLQAKLITNGAKKNPYMGFVVEPYSFFLCYELVDLEKAQQLIPDNYKLIKTKIFNEDIPKYYCIQGCFNVHTSAFWGTRSEFYIITESKDTGLLSWVIVDYDTNTVSYDQKRGLSSSNTSSCVLTTSFDGNVIIDIQNQKNRRELILESDITQGIQKTLDSRLWIEGNLSVTYGKYLSTNKGEAFSVTFNPKEFEKALYIPLSKTKIERNTWFPGLFKDSPDQLVCFPFAQHFLSDSPGHYSTIQDEHALINRVENIDFSTFSNYSSSSIKKSFQLGQLFSFILIILLLVLLILK